ncbi:hypothetical protein F6Y02_00785 [Bacillus megaterium]|nr:hypothetical protein [Priestia megaterium]
MVDSNDKLPIKVTDSISNDNSVRIRNGDDDPVNGEEVTGVTTCVTVAGFGVSRTETDVVVLARTFTLATPVA